MNCVERGSLQQQRVLTFNDFFAMQQKEAKMDACMLSCLWNVPFMLPVGFSLCTLLTRFYMEENVFNGLCSRNEGELCCTGSKVRR